MTLGLTKMYTPASGQVANSSAYNTDIAALFNAFNGLEGQTAALGGLTITPAGDSASVFRVTNAAGSNMFAVNTITGDSTFAGKGIFSGNVTVGGSMTLSAATADISCFTLECITGGATITGTTIAGTHFSGGNHLGTFDNSSYTYDNSGTNVYTAATDGIVSGYLATTSGSNHFASVKCMADTNSPPTTERCRANVASTGTASEVLNAGFSFAVKQGFKWRVLMTGGSSVSEFNITWVPLVHS